MLWRWENVHSFIFQWCFIALLPPKQLALTPELSPLLDWLCTNWSLGTGNVASRSLGITPTAIGHRRLVVLQAGHRGSCTASCSPGTGHAQIDPRGPVMLQASLQGQAMQQGGPWGAAVLQVGTRGPVMLNLISGDRACSKLVHRDWQYCKLVAREQPRSKLVLRDWPSQIGPWGPAMQQTGIRGPAVLQAGP